MAEEGKCSRRQPHRASYTHAVSSWYPQKVQESCSITGPKQTWGCNEEWDWNQHTFLFLWLTIQRPGKNNLAACSKKYLFLGGRTVNPLNSTWPLADPHCMCWLIKEKSKLASRIGDPAENPVLLYRKDGSSGEEGPRSGNKEESYSDTYEYGAIGNLLNFSLSLSFLGYTMGDDNDTTYCRNDSRIGYTKKKNVLWLKALCISCCCLLSLLGRILVALEKPIQMRALCGHEGAGEDGGLHFFRDRWFTKDPLPAGATSPHLFCFLGVGWWWCYCSHVISYCVLL